ncbi:MAG: glycoside hydrolase family 38 C-terminal domain-containing protein [bacterium]|nr:glycoside hydrolase family 38 C-terminal domain-containing protein [bacterium]
MSKQQTLYMIGNAHIDPVWLWQWQEGFHEVKASFRSALDRMNEYPDFKFVSSSAAFYEWVEQSDPAMFAEIQQRVREGRWQIVGGWWIQPDCNIPGGESYVRHALYAQRYFQEKFGVMAKVGYNVDSFGHHGMMPQLLKLAGMDSYVFMRPGPHEKGLPGRVFWWESDDGSRVLTFRIPFEYCTWGKDLEVHIRRVAGELRTPFDELMCFYGVGNHGGGPTKENIESIQRLDQEAEMPRLVFSNVNEYFARMQASDLPFPVVHDDLQHHASGCYAAHSGIKQWNRKAENLLMTAEKFSALASRLTGQPYPTNFAQAWKGVLFNQFHDIMAGTSLEPAYEDASFLYGEAMAIGGRALNLAVQALAWNINIPYEEGARPIVVFNPHAWQVKTNFEIEFGRVRDTDVLIDEDGNDVPFQTVQSVTTSDPRTRLCFLADLPPMGYRTYRLVAREARPSFPAVEATDTTLENTRYRVEFDPETGFLKSLFDKTLKIEVLAGDAARPEVIEDDSDTWGHNVFAWQKVIGAFKAVSVRCVERGPVKSVIRVVSEYGHSRLIQDFALYQDLNQIDVAVTVDWREQFRMLKLRFPVNVRFHKATFEIPYGHIERFVNGEEEPGQAWVDLSGSGRDVDVLHGLSILNDAKYSFDVNIRDIGMTVLRSPIYAHHMPAVPQPDREYSFIDQGIQRFNYTIFPHDNSWEQAGTVRRAAELNARPVGLNATYHDGKLPQRDSLLSVDAANVIVSVVKQWEDGDDLIVRAYETNRTTAHARIHLPKFNRTIEADFGPCEIKTFRVPRDESQPVVEVNLLEM